MTAPDGPGAQSLAAVSAGPPESPRTGVGGRLRGTVRSRLTSAAHEPRNVALLSVVLVWALGSAAMLLTLPPRTVRITHWANGHMMDSPGLFPAFATTFNAEGRKTDTGKRIEVNVVRANSGEISGELKSRILYGSAIDSKKPDPAIVTPAADHWVIDVNHATGQEVLDLRNVRTPATTYIGVVTSREMARCLGWPDREISLAEIVDLATDAEGWSKYTCARPEWGKEALIAFTYPSRSSTARSVLYTLYAIKAGRTPEQLTLADVANTATAQYIHRFQTAIDCYVPDTLDLNLKLLSSPPCAHFYFLAEDNLVKLYQGKVPLANADAGLARSLERDMVMLYPREGSILHNHSALTVNADFVGRDQAEAAQQWIAFLQEEPQQRAFMQEGFRRTTSGPCIAPLGSPFSPCSSTPKTIIYPDQIDPDVAAAILKAWD